MTSPDEDLAARFVQSAEQLARATRYLYSASRAALAVADDTVVLPIALPGKRPGIWEVGQEVLHPPGMWPCQHDTPGYAAACDAAGQAAAWHLDGRPGMTAFVIIRILDGNTMTGIAREDLEVNR